MAVVTIIARQVKANTPGKWAPDFYFVGVNNNPPSHKNTIVNLNGPIFAGNLSIDLGPKPDETAALMAQYYAMGIVSKEKVRRIMDFGNGS